MRLVSLKPKRSPVTQLSVRQRQGRLSSDAVAALNSDLAARFGNRFTASEAIRQAHGHTLTWLKNEPPDAVVFAEDKEDVIDLVKLCARHDAPIVPFGVGTSLEGHVNAPHGGVSLDLSRMNNVLAVNADDLDCVVEPGVTRKQLNEHLRDSGLFFPIDPGADASLGGMAATRASGTNAVRYGTMKDVVLSLGVVVADGSFLRTGTRAKKSSAGYDLTHLFIGSEGTLGIIVEVALRLSGIPEAIAAGHCSFPSIRAACETTIETIQSGLPIARIELIDTLSVRAFNTYSHPALPEQPMLLVEFHGTEQSVAEQARRFGEIAAGHGGGAFASATKPEERTKLWQARHDTYWSQHDAAARRAAVRHRRLRADLAPCRLRRGDARRHQAKRPRRADRRPCRRRQFPREPAHRHGQQGRDRGRGRFRRTASPIAPSPWAAPAPASTASARRSGNIWKRSTGRSRSTSCAASRPRSIRRTCSIRARCSTPDEARLRRLASQLSFPRKRVSERQSLLDARFRGHDR